MTSTSKRAAGALRASLLASALAVAATQAWSPSLMGEGLSPTDRPDSPYYRGEIAPPSWQGRPYAIPYDGALTLSFSRRAQGARKAEEATSAKL